MDGKSYQIGEMGMTDRLEAYRVQAFNTAKLSENKMHDDTVAKRFGFSGGPGPGDLGVAAMELLPAPNWGPAFLSHGLIASSILYPVSAPGPAPASGAGSARALSM